MPTGNERPAIGVVTALALWTPGAMMEGNWDRTEFFQMGAPLLIPTSFGFLEAIEQGPLCLVDLDAG